MSRNQRGQYLLGDIIIKIDGKEVNNYDEIFNVLDNYNVGDTVQLTFKRGNALKKTKLKLMEI